MGCERALRILCRAFLGIGVVLCLYVLAGKLFLLGGLAAWIAGAAGAGILLAAIFISARRWPTRRAAAFEIDERLNLGERVSSALAVRNIHGAMAEAVVADARGYARNAPVSEAFPVRLHREAWGVAGAAVLATALAAWMPQFDLLSQHEKLLREQKEREVVQREGERLREVVKKLREEADRGHLPDMEGHLEKMEEVVKAMETGGLKREEAMAKLGDLSEMFRQERAAMPKDNSVSQALAGRRDLEMTKDMAKALAAKDFAKAGKSLKQLADAAAKGELSKEQKEKLEKELKEIAKSLKDDKKLSDALNSLSQALTESDMANLEQALGQAMGDMDKLAEMEAELKMLQAVAGVLEDGKNGLGGEGEGDAFGEARTWSGANPYSPGDETDQVGPGIGGPGRGVGGIAPVKPDDVDFSPTRIRGQLKPGRVVGSFFVNGKDLKGDAKAEYLQTVTAAQAEAAQAMQDQKVPRGYETYVRDYFHGMKSDNEEK
jgi:hypothetical protein